MKLTRKKLIFHSSVFNFIKKNRFNLYLLVILVLAFILRFYDYQNRWGLAYDQSHDALVALGAIELHQVPLVGPFSSAGPFQTSGIWYWFIIIGTLIAPNIMISPWILLTLLYVLYVFLMAHIGKKLEGETFGLFVGILTAVSTAQITQSVNLTNQGPLALISGSSVLDLLLYVEKKKDIYIFLLSFLCVLAATVHAQGFLLLLLLLFTLGIAKVPLRQWIYLPVGAFLALLPLIIFDIQNDFINFKAMMRYMLVDQYKVSLDILGRRWITYLSNFWPKGWSFIIGGRQELGYIFIITSVILVIFKLFKKTLSKVWLILALTFGTSVVVIRYIRTPIYDSYLVMLHTFVLLFSAWIIYLLYLKYKKLGFLVLGCVVILTLIQGIPLITASTNTTALASRNAIFQIEKHFPDSKFKLYDFKYLSADRSLPISLYLSHQQKSSDSGRKIGVIRYSAVELKNMKNIGAYSELVFVDLDGFSEAQLKKDWIEVLPKAVYESTEDWYKNGKR